LQIGPSFTGNAVIIFRSARRSRAGHLPQMTQSSSEIGLESESADIAAPMPFAGDSESTGAFSGLAANP
jgi:hypothetical protein